MNETLFFLHLFAVCLFLWPALKKGKEGLFCWIGLQPILANLFVLKQIELFGFIVTCSDVYAVSTALGLNLLQEYYGKEAAKKAVWLCFYLLVFFVAMSLVHLLYLASPLDNTQHAYMQIFSATPRLVVASIVSFSLVQWLDVQFFGFLKKKFAKTSLFTRNIMSLTLSQFVDTLLFTFLGLWGLVSMLFDVFLVSFFIKLSIALLLSLSSLKKYEHVSV